MDFSKRSYQAELLDADDIPQADLYRNLRELAFINSYLGGHALTLRGLEKLLQPARKHYHIVDIGSGGGDSLKNIALWGRKKKLDLQLTGIDLKADCIAYARENCRDYPEISFIQSDYRAQQGIKADIFTSMLFCHHLPDDALKGYFQWVSQNAAVGFLVNDLHRHALAYGSIKLLSKLFSSSYLVKNDAPLSVRRAFRKAEWQAFLPEAIRQEVKVEWAWAFRWLVYYRQV